ncbi:hypothetical protein QBC38DRAFT_460465 [Podospora fimiseda]|uniref:C2H2-type domain-containing protein n=1 Tax=Podospora fimiseda TaxID=252190 RepID=A0AAN7BE38_9PEZI|nr:hypothetical protein QBC38DRAFT_460465 [Podospora fimiseda]
MAAIPIQAPPRYPRDNDALPSLSGREHGFPNRPFGSMFSHPNNDNLSPSAGSRPLSIREQPGDYMNGVPPPLPPPRLPPIDGPVDHDVHMKERMREHRMRREDVGSPDSALGMSGSSRAGRHWPSRSEYDEGYQSFDSHRSPGFSPSFGQTMKSFRPDSIDGGMLNKLNRPAPRSSGLSNSINGFPAPRAPFGQLTNLSLPHRNKQPLLDASFTRSPGPMSATSPGNIPFSHRVSGPMDYRSPVSAADSEFERSPLPRTQRLLSTHSVAESEASVTMHSYDGREEEDGFPMEETRGMRSLNIEDQWRDRDGYQPGQKRRASSPPSDDQPGMNRSRDGPAGSRGSPTPRLLSMPQGTSVGGLSPVSRSGSYNSGLTPGGITFARRSPTGLGPGGLSPTDPMGNGNSSLFGTSLSSGPPRSAIAIGMGRSAAGAAQHPGMARGAMVSPRKLAEIPKNPAASALGAKLRGPYMCECCPKKPKKFETEEELRIHEAEKQYECSFCGNRFKNKNEAERHQNSLHVRRHSWSCSALTGYPRAFHDSTATPGEADTCGYCGKEFGRNGPNATVSDDDWEKRVRHLQDVHKFRECNASKKFFRADHFRQHLKHSHAGTSGKWTNMLENACMIEEDPVPMGR